MPGSDDHRPAGDHPYRHQGTKGCGEDNDGDGRIVNISQISYCRDPKTIILCVIPANQDLAISDGLKLAREWDRDGIRTIGVITKIDIMDKGTSAKRMLMNEEIHLKLGYIGIVNRAQEDIVNKVPVEVALKREVEFFNKHPEYRDLPERVIGTRSLTSKLSELLVDAIKRSLPDIMKQI